jgi:hypothetical protein
MGKRLRVLLLGLGLFLPCAWLALLVFVPGDRINETRIRHIREGMTETEVTALLGTPPGWPSTPGSLIQYAERGSPAFLGKERPGLKLLKIKDLHAVEWVGDRDAVKVWFDDQDRVVAVVPGKVLGAQESLLARIRRWLAG